MSVGLPAVKSLFLQAVSMTPVTNITAGNVPFISGQLDSGLKVMKNVAMRLYLFHAVGPDPPLVAIGEPHFPEIPEFLLNVDGGAGVQYEELISRIAGSAATGDDAAGDNSLPVMIYQRVVPDSQRDHHQR